LVFHKQFPELKLKMTEGNQDDATQQLNEDKEADEKPVQDISEQGTGDSVLQLASGVPGDGDHPVQEQSKQEDETEKLDQSKPEDSSPQEPTASESVPESQASGEPVQVADSETPVNSDEHVQKKSGDEKPAESEGYTDNAEKGTEENGKPEDTSDGEEQPEIQQAEQTEEGGERVPQGTNGSMDQVASEEQQGKEKPEGQSEEAQKEGDEQQQHEIPSASQVEQQEILAPSQEKGDKPAQDEGEAEKPALESESQEATEKQESEEAAGEQAKAEANQTDGDTTKESSPNENSPESEDQLTPDESQAEAAKDSEAAEEGQKVDDSVEKPDTKPDESENAQEHETVEAASAESEPVTERLEESAGEVDKPVESQQQVQSEASSVSKPAVVAAGQVASLPADEPSPKKPDEVQEENKKLKQDIFIMKQQEDAYRIKVLSLEQEVGKLRARKIDNRSQDSLASDSDSYLKQKLGETERELDAAERKVKDLQLRLKRFAKDDQIKDEKIFQMEREVKELSDHIKKLEQSLAESKRENNNNTTVQASADKQDSKVCVIL